MDIFHVLVSYKKWFLDNGNKLLTLIINVSTDLLKWHPIPDKNAGIYVSP